jgi:hypothetical protein
MGIVITRSHRGTEEYKRIPLRGPVRVNSSLLIVALNKWLVNSGTYIVLGIDNSGFEYYLSIDGSDRKYISRI